MRPVPCASLITDPGYGKLKEYVIKETGLSYYLDKDEDLAGHLAKRMETVGITGCAEYLSLLEVSESGNDEMNLLIQHLTIGETFFFRHPESFDALKKTVIPDLLRKKEMTRHLRIWSAGCATGAEPYSLSILLRQMLGSSVSKWNVSIVATDINLEFLERGREGRFEEWAFRGTPESLRQQCFLPAGKSWIIKPEFKEGVSFQYHNLVSDSIPSSWHEVEAFDLILCRNVTIYFSLEMTRRVIALLHRSLGDGGWLVVGHSEPNQELYRQFQTLDGEGVVLYQKTNTPCLTPIWRSVVQVGSLPTPATLGSETDFVPRNAFSEPLVCATESDEWAADTPIQSSGKQPQVLVNDLGHIRSLADRGEWAEALERCERLLVEDRLNAEVYFVQGLILDQMPPHDGAEASFRRALYLSRDFVLAHYYLGLLQQKKGQSKQAEQSFQNVLQLLARLPSREMLRCGEGMRAKDLARLTRIHLQLLRTR